ncbi:HAD family hydrolase [Parachitinimonas caeni]|uniref:HAD family phosphatase n=1 Tax=Parachitinimonas caeni TaxID=3031301 RepID=A0ABT7DY86_9NEIS|nr:HAD family phosphatase [Parachitinimonas caeni]MDK2125025.1 HAD family phosphatase [Parachitinimonas caeni]
MQFDAVVFDFGGVLFDWNPHYLYQHLIPDLAAREQFLAEVCTLDWNAHQDAGRPISEALDEKIAAFPHLEDLIRPYYERWPETLAGTLPAGISLLDALHTAGVPLYGLTNWSAETFPYAEAHYPQVIGKFRDIVVSGQEKLAKPDPAIYHLLLNRIGHAAERCIFIDDSAKNIAAAEQIGFLAIHHTDPAHTRSRLREWGAPLD